MRLITLFSILFIAVNAFSQVQSEPSVNDVKKAEKIRLIFEDTPNYIEIVGAHDGLIKILYNKNYYRAPKIKIDRTPINTNTTNNFNLTIETIVWLDGCCSTMEVSDSVSHYLFQSNYEKNNQFFTLTLSDNTFSLFLSLNNNNQLEVTGKLKEILFYNDNNLTHKSCENKNFSKLLYHWIDKYTPKYPCIEIH